MHDITKLTFKKKIVKYRRNLTFICIFNNILFHIIISLYHKT